MKKCIICGEAAGSHEHVFPAALGGRRTNKGIYCTPHNNGFGRHVAELEKQLSLLNAILMIRPDRRDEPKSCVFSDKEGSNFSLVGQNMQIAPPPSIDELKLESGNTTTQKFSSQKQFEQWREAQRKSGWEPRIVGSSESRNSYFTGPVEVPWTFGGKEVLQAVGYLALTFFAQYYPAEVRQKGFDSFKDFLALDFLKTEDQWGWSPNLVWWDGRDAKEVVGEMPFTFGHAVALGISQSTNRSYAYISFFSSLNFGIDLGPVEDAQESMVVVFIDPKAESAPDDIDVKRSDKFSIEIGPTISDLGTMIRSGSAQAAMTQFFAKVGAWQFDLFIDEIQDEMTDWEKNSSTEGSNLEMHLVKKYSQRVLNLLSQVSTNLKSTFNDSRQITVLLDSIVESDDKQPNGLSPRTNAFLETAKRMIAKAVKKELDTENPSAESIALLFDGGPGLVVVTESVVLPILLNSRRVDLH